MKEAGEMPKTTKEMNTTTKEMNLTTGEMRDITKDMSQTTHEMKDITSGMATTTEGMAVTTQDMARVTKEMKSTTNDMYIQLRSKEAESTRAEKIKELLNPASDLGTKITAACIFFKSFEYQLATANEFKHDEKMMDEMRLDAVNEFTRRMLDLYNKVNTAKMSPTKDGKKHSDELAFYAMAATLHMNHTFQINTAEHSKAKAISFLDIIKTALTKEKNGEALKEYEDQLLTGLNREITIELLKARVDIISAIALSYMTDKREMGIGSKLKALLFMGTKGKLSGIELPLTIEDSNSSTKLNAKKALDEAVNTRNFLKSLGVEKKLEKMVRSAYSNIDIVRVMERKESRGEKIPGKEELEEIDRLIKELLE
jgi:hypothetical protein